MPRYAIWDKVSNVYTLVGEELTPEQWLSRFGWARIPQVYMVVGGGVINGTVAFEYSSFVAEFVKRGLVITEGMSKQDILDAIEIFEDTPIEPSVVDNTQQRIADALQDLVVLNMPDAV